MKTILPFEANQMVNKIGKYLYKHIDGAYKFSTSSTQCDVYMKVYYQLSPWDQVPGKGKEYNDVHEMKIDINITTYRNNIRANIITMDPYEKTIAHYVFAPTELTNMQQARDLIFDTLVRALEKEYEDYNFVF